MKENIVAVRSFDFAKEIVFLCRRLNAEKKEFALTNQLLRSGTTIGAMVKEAQQAESRADFRHKIAVALKRLLKRITG